MNLAARVTRATEFFRGGWAASPPPLQAATPPQARVFSEVHRVLRSGGRLALADIVTDVQLPESVTCDSSLWAACIGGAAQQDRYRETVESAGLRVARIRHNPEYRFLSRSAQGASRQYGVKSISLRADRGS